MLLVKKNEIDFHVSFHTIQYYSMLFSESNSDIFLSVECKSILPLPNLAEMHTEFFSYLSHPVAEHVMVYTTPKIFSAVLSRLNQKCLPVSAIKEYIKYS